VEKNNPKLEEIASHYLKIVVNGLPMSLPTGLLFFGVSTSYKNSAPTELKTMLNA